MSAAQRDAYEDNKLKMRKAMADPDLVDEMDEVLQREGGICERGNVTRIDVAWSQCFDACVRPFITGFLFPPFMPIGKSYHL